MTAAVLTIDEARVLRAAYAQQRDAERRAELLRRMNITLPIFHLIEDVCAQTGLDRDEAVEHIDAFWADFVKRARAWREHEVAATSLQKDPSRG